MDVAIARMEGLERRIDAAYNALDQAIKSETQHWSRWTYFTVCSPESSGDSWCW